MTDEKPPKKHGGGKPRLTEGVTISLLLAPGQWKLQHGIKIRNQSKLTKRVVLIVADLEKEDKI